MNCKTFTPNSGYYKGQEISSPLYTKLLEHTQGNIVRADNIYNLMFTEGFMEFVGNNWITNPQNLTDYGEPNINDVLAYYDHVYGQDALLRPLTDAEKQALKDAELSSLIIEDLGVIKQEKVVHFVSQVIAKNVIEQKRMTSEKAFSLVENHFKDVQTKLEKDLKEATSQEEKGKITQELYDTRVVRRNWDKVKELTIRRISKMGSASYKSTEDLESLEENDAAMEKRNFEDNATFQIDGKETLSTRLKRFLHGIRVMEIKDEENAEPVQGYLPGMDLYVPFDTVYNTISAILANQPADYETLLDELAEYEEAYPWLIDLISKLEEAPEEVKTDFVVAMTKHYVPMKFVMWKFNPKTGLFDIGIFDANANAIARTVRVNWQDNLRNSDLLRPSPKNSADLIYSANVQPLLEEFEEWVSISRGRFILKAEAKEKIKTRGRTWLEEFGIRLTDKAWHALVDSTETRITKKKRFTNHFVKKGGIFRDIYEAVSIAYEQGYPVSTHDIISDLTSISNLSKLEGKYRERILSNSHRSGNKTVYSYSMNKYVINRSRLLKEDHDLLTNLSRLPFSSGSLWLNQLSRPAKKNPEKRIPQFASAYHEKFSYFYLGLESLKEMGSSLTGKPVKALSPAEYEIIRFNMFANKGAKVTVDDSGTQKRVINSFYPTMSDKTIALGFQHIGEQVGIEYLEGKARLDRKSLKMLREQLVMPELRRIYEMQESQKSKNIKGFDDGWSIVYSIPEINGLENLFKPDGSLKDDYLENKATHLAIEEIINSHFQGLLQDKLSEWQNFGIGKREFDPETNKEVKSFAFIDAGYVNNGIPGNIKDYGRKVQFAAADFIFNSLIARANMFQLFVGDSALFFKDSSKTFKSARERLELDSSVSNQEVFNKMNAEEKLQVIKDTFDNVGKRLAADMAPGYELNDSENNSYKVLFLEDPEVDSSAMDFYKKNLGARAEDYKDIESADAQEFTTLSEHLYVMRQLGKMNVSLYDKVSSIIESVVSDKNYDGTQNYMDKIREELTEKELETFNSIVYQPMKPVYANNQVNMKKMIDKRVYVKTSSYPLTPDLVGNTQLNKLRVFMEKNGIQRAAFMTGVKVGGPKNAAKIYDAESNIDTSNIDLELHTTHLPRTGFRIQQEIPYDKTKKEVNVGTQERKLLFLNLMGVEGFVDPTTGKKTNGAKLFDKYQKIYGELTFIAMQDLSYELMGENGVDPYKLRSILIDEAVKRNYPINDFLSLEIDQNTGKFKIPLWASGSADKIESLLQSIIDNRVRKLKMPGKSFVLSTEEGYKNETVVEEGTEETVTEWANKIVWTEAWDGGGLKPMREDENGNILPSQILVPFKFLDNRGNPMKLSDFTKKVNGKLMLDMDKLDPELLKVFGFRIPTQGFNSMNYMEIVGFLPENAGDMVIASKDLVVQMGSDFDVDKLYTYMFHTNTEYYDPETLQELDAINKKILELIEDNPQRLDDSYQDKIARRAEIKEIQETLKDKYGFGTFTIPVNYGEVTQEVKVKTFNTFAKEAMYVNPSKYGAIYNDVKDYLAKNIDNKELLLRINSATYTDSLKDSDPVAYGHLEKLDDFIPEKDLETVRVLKKLMTSFNQEINSLNSALQKEVDAINKDIIDNYVAVSKDLKTLKERKKKIKEEKRSPKISKYSQDVISFKSLNLTEDQKNIIRENGLAAYQSLRHAIKIEGTKKVKDTMLLVLEDHPRRDEVLNHIDRYKDKLRNEIIDIHFSVLSNPDKRVQSQIHKPLDFGDLKGGKDLAEKVVELRKGKSKEGTFSPYSDKHQRQKFAAAMAGRVGGVGVFSLDSVFNAVVQHAYVQGGKLEYQNRILVPAGDKMKLIKVPAIIPYGNRKIPAQFFGEKTFKGNKFKSDVIASFQSAAVDNENEQILNKINVNPETFSIIRAMAQMGFDEEQIISFISQDVIIELAENLIAERQSTKEFNPRMEEEVMIRLIEKYLPKNNSIAADYIYENLEEFLRDQVTNTKAIGSFLNEENLYKMIGETDTNNPDYRKTQLYVLLYSLQAKRIGDAIQAAQSAINTDSAGVSNSIIEAQVKNGKIDDLIRGPIKDVVHLLGTPIKGPKGEFLGIDYNTINGHYHAVNGLIGLWDYPYWEVSALFEHMSKLLNKEDRSVASTAEFYKKIWKEFRSFMFSRVATLDLSTENANSERERLMLDQFENKKQVHYSLAAILHELSASPYYQTHPFLSRLRLRLGKGELPSTIEMNNSTKENFDELSIYSSFYQMITEPHNLGIFNGKMYTTADLARELVLYSFVTGAKQGPSQFHSYIPVNYLQEIGFVKYLNDPQLFNASILDEIIQNQFAIQYIQHNPGQVTRIDKGELRYTPNKFTYDDEYDIKQIVKDPDILIDHVDALGVFYQNQFSIYDEELPEKYILFVKNPKTGNYKKTPILGTKMLGTRVISPITEYEATEVTVRPILPSAKTNVVLSKYEETDADTGVIALQSEILADNDFEHDGSIIDVLDAIAYNSTNKSYIDLSGQLVDIASELDITTKIADDEMRTKYPKINNSVGLSIYDGNIILLNPDFINSQEEFEEVVLHETIHMLTKDLIVRYRYDKESLTDEQVKLLDRLEALRNAYREKVGPGKIDQFISDLETNGTAEITKEEIATLYSAKNLEEFVAMVASNKTSQRALNAAGLWKDFSDLIVKLLESLGIKFNNDWGDVAVRDIMSLIKTLPQTPVTPPINKETITPSEKEVSPVSTPESPLSVYVDGSHIKGGGNLGFGVYTELNGQSYKRSFSTTPGELKQNVKENLGIDLPSNSASNGVMELLATLSILEDTPAGEYLHIHQDHEGVLMWIHARIIMELAEDATKAGKPVKGSELSEKGYKKWWKGLSPEQQAAYDQTASNIINIDPNLKKKHTYAGETKAKGYYPKDPNVRVIIDRIAELILSKHTSNVKISWVKGHQTGGSEQARLNDQADGVAKDVTNYNTLSNLFEGDAMYMGQEFNQGYLMDTTSVIAKLLSMKTIKKEC
jgi:hypothetical protein